MTKKAASEGIGFYEQHTVECRRLCDEIPRIPMEQEI
jgi:hypothetical protein